MRRSLLGALRTRPALSGVREAREEAPLHPAERGEARAVKVGDSVLIRPNVSGWSNQHGTIKDVRNDLYLVRFRDGAELWYMRKELLRG